MTHTQMRERAPPDRGSSTALADLNADGARDLIVGTADFGAAGNVMVYLNAP